jgi:hypothetical protein
LNHRHDCKTPWLMVTVYHVPCTWDSDLTVFELGNLGAKHHDTMFMHFPRRFNDSERIVGNL